MACNKIVIASLLFMAVFFNSKGFTQQPSIVEEIKHANYAEIHFLKGKQPCVYKTKRAIDLTYLKTLIANAKHDPSLKCDTTGIIIYFKDKVELGKVYFSSRGTDSKYKNSNAVVFSTKNKNVTSALNYGTGMLVDEAFYSLQKYK